MYFQLSLLSAWKYTCVRRLLVSPWNQMMSEQWAQKFHTDFPALVDKLGNSVTWSTLHSLSTALSYALVPQTSFYQEASGGIMKCHLFPNRLPSRTIQTGLVNFTPRARIRQAFLPFCLPRAIACLSYDMHGTLPVGQVRLNSYLPSKVIYLFQMTLDRTLVNSWPQWTLLLYSLFFYLILNRYEWKTGTTLELLLASVYLKPLSVWIDLFLYSFSSLYIVPHLKGFTFWMHCCLGNIHSNWTMDNIVLGCYLIA